MQEEKKISIPLIIGGLVLVIIVGAGGILIAINQISPSTNNTATTPTTVVPTTIASTPTTTTTTPTTTTATYKDGTYTSTGSYMSPAGDESIGVSVTIVNDTITAVKVTPEATDEESARYQSRFASGISAAIVGKKLSATSVGRVNGSSLTGTGFNSALARIKSQAQA